MIQSGSNAMIFLLANTGPITLQRTPWPAFTLFVIMCVLIRKCFCEAIHASPESLDKLSKVIRNYV